MSNWAGMWRQYTLSKCPPAPGNACFGTHKCQCLPSKRVCLGVLMVGGVYWPEMAASPGSVGSWRPVILSFPIRGHHTDCAARSLHFATPMWPSWILSRICFLKLKGTTILSSLTKSPSWRLSSPLMIKKSLAANWTYLIILSPAMNSVLNGCFEVHIFQSLCSDLGQSCVWHLPWWLDVADLSLNFLMGTAFECGYRTARQGISH